MNQAVNLQFNKDFQRKRTSNGLQYTFRVATYPSDGDNLCVDGDKLILNDSILTIQEKCKNLPEECSNPVRYKTLFTQWLKDCSGVFLKPPTVNQCLSNASSFYDTSVNIVTITPEEEEDDWILLWVPTVLQLLNGAFQIGWAPLLKRKCTRIPVLTELFEMEEANLNEIHEVQISSQPEVQIEPSTRSSDIWSQNLLELETTSNLESQKEKLRKRIHDARIRAKLARYRSEQLANMYYRKFGVWPEEDEEEAETVFETSSDESQGN